MKKSESEMLTEAYLSIAKKTTSMPGENEDVSTDPNSVVDVGAMEEPAPGVDMNMIDSEVQDIGPEDKDTTGVAVDMSPAMPSEDMSQENEEDEMAIENLDSIRESIMKIASFCASGGHLEVWAQQKLAIAMDNLASVARSVKV